MHNRFNLNEEEKDRIRGLHYDENRKFGIWEQTNTGDTTTGDTESQTGDTITVPIITIEQILPRHIRKGSKEHADWVRSQQDDGSDELLENLLHGAQRLTRFVEDTRDGSSRDDLRDIQKVIDDNI